MNRKEKDTIILKSILKMNDTTEKIGIYIYIYIYIYTYIYMYKLCTQ